MHYVFEHELETLGNVNFQAALHMALFGVSVGAAISFGVTTATVEIANPYTYAAFLCLTVLSCLMTFYFGIRSLIDFMNAKKQLNALKQVRENSESAL